MHDYLTLTANWDLGDGIDPDQQMFEFALGTYDSSVIATATFSKAVWEGMGCPTTIYVKAAPE